VQVQYTLKFADTSTGAFRKQS